MNNEPVYTEIEAIIQRIQHGELTFTAKLFRGEIRGITVYGKQKVRKRENMESMVEIANRIKKSIDNGQNTDLNFTVRVRNGNILECEWDTSINRQYDQKSIAQTK